MLEILLIGFQIYVHTYMRLHENIFMFGYKHINRDTTNQIQSSFWKM